MSNVNTHSQFYQYVTKKYTSITDIDYKDNALNSYRQDESKSVYLNGLVDFFKLTVPIRNELILPGLPDGVDPFETLDPVDARINHLNWWSATTNQAFNICITPNNPIIPKAFIS
jgi:hypothetical protein